LLSVGLNFLFSHAKVIFDHFLLNIWIINREPIIDATQRINDALAITISQSSILILIIPKKSSKEISKFGKKVFCKNKDIILVSQTILLIFILNYFEECFDHLIRPIGIEILLKVPRDVDRCLLRFVHLYGFVDSPQRYLKTSAFLLGWVTLVLDVGERDHVGLELDVSLLDLGDRGCMGDRSVS
jgi:hypothetical protein